MGGGGKGGSSSVPAQQPTYIDPVTGKSYRNSNALNMAIDARTAQEKTASEAAKAEAEAKRVADLASFNTRLDSAYGQSQQNINQYFTGMGVDPSQYADYITQALNTRKASVPSLDPNPMGTFGSNLGQEIANMITSGKQTQARTALDQKFGNNYAASELPLELIDPVVNQILGSQFDPLNTQLENAMKRRTLTQPGYAGALNQLSQDKTAGRSTVSRLGTNVIFSDRGDVNDFLNSAYTSASNLSLPSASMFDPNSYYNEAESRTDRYRGNLYGDVLNALGDAPLSNIQRLLNAGGVAQGATDPTATNPSGAVGPGGNGIGGVTDPNYIAQQVLQNRRRGLGTQGQF